MVCAFIFVRCKVSSGCDQIWHGKTCGRGMYWGGGHTRSDTKGAWPSFLQIFCPPPDSLDLGRQYGLTQSDRIRHVNTGQGGACFYGSDFIKGREPGVHKFFGILADTRTVWATRPNSTRWHRRVFLGTRHAPMLRGVDPVPPKKKWGKPRWRPYDLT